MKLKPGWRIEGDRLIDPHGAIVADYDRESNLTVARGVLLGEGRKMKEAYLRYDPHLDLIGPQEKQLEVMNAYTESRFPGFNLQWRAEHSIRTYSLYMDGVQLSPPSYGYDEKRLSTSNVYMDNHGAAVKRALDLLQELFTFSGITAPGGLTA